MTVRSVFLAFCWAAAAAAAPLDRPREIRMSLDDRFRLAPSDRWDVSVERELSLRFADVHITPRTGQDFDLMLYFKCDTPDLAVFDTPEKMEWSLLKSSESYRPHVRETIFEPKRLDVGGRYGFLLVLTDAKLADLDVVPEGQFKYLFRGMVRLSDDSALGFSLMANERDSPLVDELLGYAYGFVRAKE